jgi:hypothetical protein
MEHFSLMELWSIKKRMIEEKFEDKELFNLVLETIKVKEQLILEDTSATGGPAGSVGGMGAVVSAQPSGLAGQTIGTNWASGGGTIGSGDISVPYNPSGSNRVFQKLQSPMGKDHGPRTGKKSRVKKLDLKALKDIFSKRQDFTSGEGEREQGIKGKGKVMNFNNFFKSDFNTIKK